MRTTHDAPSAPIELTPSGLFELKGYFEDVCDAASGKCLGTRTVPAPTDGRPCSYHGIREETVTSPLQLMRGHKAHTFFASPAKPLKIRTSLQIICGRIAWRGAQETQAMSQHFKERVRA